MLVDPVRVLTLRAEGCLSMARHYLTWARAWADDRNEPAAPALVRANLDSAIGGLIEAVGLIEAIAARAVPA